MWYINLFSAGDEDFHILTPDSKVKHKIQYRFSMFLLTFIQAIENDEDMLEKI